MPTDASPDSDAPVTNGEYDGVATIRRPGPLLPAGVIPMPRESRGYRLK